MNTVIVAQSAFDALPARIRERFRNDPAQFLHFMSEDSNLPEMIKLGLATPTPKESKSNSPVEPKAEPQGSTPPDAKQKGVKSTVPT